jgi:ubiquitin-protein ligase
MTDPRAARRQSDLAKLMELQRRVPRMLEITRTSGNPVQRIELRVTVPTARDANFPSVRQEVTKATIEFPENYPFPPGGPLVMIETSIWNPNVFDGGKWCYGEWNLSENLALFVGRLIRVIALDPQIVNPNSPANRDAAKWYERLRKTNRSLVLPTADLSGLAEPIKPHITWRDRN